MVMALGKSVGKPRQSGFTTEGSPPFGDPERGDSLISTVISAGYGLPNWREYSRLFGLVARLTRGVDASSSSDSPNDGRGADLAIFTGIWTHSSCRLRLNAWQSNASCWRGRWLRP